MAERIGADCSRLGLGRVLVTGGDAEGLLDAGLAAHHEPSLVLKGLAAVDGESERE